MKTTSNTLSQRLLMPLFILAAAASTVAAASPAGTVINQSGFLVAQRADGSLKVLAANSQVQAGETLISESSSYARIRLQDDSEITLGPQTRLTIEAVSFDVNSPAADRISLSLAAGSVATVTGEISKRSPGKFSLTTPQGSIGGDGRSRFDVFYIAPTVTTMATATLTDYALSSLAAGDGSMNDAGGAAFAELVPAIERNRSLPLPLLIAATQLAQLTLPPPKQPALPPGLYVSVIDGAINLSNKGGTTNFSAGQFGYTANVTTPPVIVPANPGLKFTPPPTFTATSSTTSATSGKAAAVDCVVR